jgi:hypothetical protein
MESASLARLLFLTLSLAALTGCGAGGQGGNGSQTIDLGILQPLVGTEEQTMLFVREEEKMARDVYVTLYNQWFEPSFYNIATKSEQKHMDSVKAMLDNLGIADPVVSDATGEFTNSTIAGLYTQLVTRGTASVNEALSVGAYIEEYDIVDVQHAKDEIIAGSNQTPIILTYDNLLCGSRNHLRSFVSRLGVTYTAQIITQAEVDAITSTPSEQCGI